LVGSITPTLISLPVGADPVLAVLVLDPVVDEVLLLVDEEEELHAVAIMANAHTAAPAASF
jgi:hypothetical protein